jgi:hypothetical protein
MQLCGVMSMETLLVVGSSGMLPKPIKVENVLRMIQCNMGKYLSQGLIQLSGDKLVMDDGGLQIGMQQSMKEVEDDKTEANFLKETAGERVMATGMATGVPLAGPWAGGAPQRITDDEFDPTAIIAEPVNDRFGEPGSIVGFVLARIPPRSPWFCCRCPHHLRTWFL